MSNIFKLRNIDRLTREKSLLDEIFEEPVNVSYFGCVVDYLTIVLKIY